VVAGVLALGLRGGVLASALAWGLPLGLAVALGLALAWGLRAVGEWRFMLRLAAAPVGQRGPLAAGTLLLAIALLHLAYLKVFPLLPEEVATELPPAPPWLPTTADGGLADRAGRGAAGPSEP
jgi:hypothetical protein